MTLISTVMWTVTALAAAQAELFTAVFEGAEITSSKALNPVEPTPPAGPPCCASTIKEQFLYHGVCYCGVFPAEQGPNLVPGSPLQVTPASGKNLAVYNPLYLPDIPNLLKPLPATIIVQHQLKRTYKAFTLKKICYACETPAPEGGANAPLPLTVVEMVGYVSENKKSEIMNLDFGIRVDDKMVCKDIPSGKGFDKVAKVELQCAIVVKLFGIELYRDYVGVTTVIDNVEMDLIPI